MQAWGKGCTPAVRVWARGRVLIKNGRGGSGFDKGG